MVHGFHEVVQIFENKQALQKPAAGVITKFPYRINKLVRGDMW